MMNSGSASQRLNCLLIYDIFHFLSETDVRRSNVSELHSFFYQYDNFGKLALLSPILTLEFFSFGRIPPNIALNEIYFVFCEILFFVDFFDKSNFLTFGFKLLSFDKSSVETPHIFFSFFLRSYEQKRKKRKVKKIQAIFFYYFF